MRRKLLVFFGLALIMGCGPFSHEAKIVKDYVWLSLESTGDDEIIRVDEKGKFKASVIEPYVFSIGWNNSFIIAKRKPTDSNENVIEWYIVRLSDDKVFGPYDENEFNRMKNELGVPANDQLQFMPKDSF